jgi:hypothetical protein
MCALPSWLICRLTKRWSEPLTRHGESSTGFWFYETLSARDSLPAVAGQRSLSLVSLDVMRVTLVSLLAAICVGCAAKGVVPNDVFAFRSPQEQQQFERRAATGDIEAVKRLTDYYFFYRHDNRRALYWARVGASHGDKDSAKSARTIEGIIKEQNG